uniref:Uncharacterized protein n=1 Tax=viral metagenome TaxID=1070528 RepID=A0A6M3KTP3_9ZZZZ
MELQPGEKGIKELFVGKCWDYLNDNFHKFTETNKIKIALEITKKNMPTEFKGNFTFNNMPTATVNGQPLEINVGDTHTT